MPPSPTLDRIRFDARDTVPVHAVAELELTVDRDVPDPWGELRIDVAFTDPGGTTRTVPAFWAGGRSWKARYSSGIAGAHRYRVATNLPCGLDDASGEVTVGSYSGTNPLLLHGGPRVADDGRRLAHADGTPFLWLADTWWVGMGGRFEWPTTFQTLADDRAAKGFNVVQIVAGLVPETVPFSPAFASEGGQPWTDLGHGQINPAFFDVPDEKLDYLVAKGISPCIVGGWGCFATTMGRERILQHWRYLVARYAAYPVTWCIAGEGNAIGGWERMARRREERTPTIVHDTLTHAEILDRLDPLRFEHSWLDELSGELKERNDRARDEQNATWEAASILVGEIDPFHRIRTVHVSPLAHEGGSSAVFSSRDSFDLDMLQTGHTGIASVPDTMRWLRQSLDRNDKPVLNGECSYEGIFDSNWNDVQTFLFWSHLLTGAAGHTYGTMAISCFSSAAAPFMSLGQVSLHHWEDAITWNGARNVGVGKRILERFPWWTLESAQEYVEGGAGPDNWLLPFAGRLHDGRVLVYRPNATTIGLGLIPTGNQWTAWTAGVVVKDLPAASYAVSFIDPTDGTDHTTPQTTLTTADGPVSIPTPTMADWIVVLRPID